ncbi:uncharacterized protein LOC117643920 [Thrips palmi]|uniref:Uncharacterized protein LOC117643920 n=1 Tax=Thrips palmi TaxID=161013 RepID=A0A6P8YXP4_THRPL|nr:uncharacterized protein LOC117643920 [Thrips palmi]
MRLSARILLVVILALVGICNSDGDLDESSERLDDFGDLSLDDNESEPHSDLSHLSDDEFLAGDAEGGAAAGPGQRPGQRPGRPGEVQAEKSAMMLRVMGATLKRPGMTQRFGQILPIIRVMSPPQRLALAALVMQQAMVPEHVNDPPLQMAMKLGATPDGKSNLTTQLLLPLSADIAHIFRGAGLPKAGENLYIMVNSLYIYGGAVDLNHTMKNSLHIDFDEFHFRIGENLHHNMAVQSLSP